MATEKKSDEALLAQDSDLQDYLLHLAHGHLGELLQSAETVHNRVHAHGATSVLTEDDLRDAGAALLSYLGHVAEAVEFDGLQVGFVGLVQGAGISANFPNPDGRYPDASRDFLGQGVANVASGMFQGMPVGGSVSASALNKEAGARSRWSLVMASAVMAVVIVAFGPVVDEVAMPALAGLLMLIGYRTVKPADLQSVWRTGPVQKAVLAVTFALTMIIPLQYAVLVGVGLSVLLHVVR